MTYAQSLAAAIEKLSNSGNDDAWFDAWELACIAFSKNRTQLLADEKTDAPAEQCECFEDLVNRRCGGEPLQYMIGKWEFYGNEFYCGPGVLIPRPDTELLCDRAVKLLKEHSEITLITDLCAGTGCISVSLAKIFPDRDFIAVEKYDEAFTFLEKNIAHHGCTNVTALKDDVTDPSGTSLFLQPQLILSNPPYISTQDMKTLSREVLSEPHTALCGGDDGLEFYRAIREHYGDVLASGGYFIFECGEHQGEKIISLFSDICTGSELLKDPAGNDRTVVLERS